jgi:Zn-dependent protease with chaperone function
MPALTYDESGEINAGVTGTGPHDAVLFFSDGALRKLSDREAVALAAHELAHISAGDFDVCGGRLAHERRHRLSFGSWLSDLIGLATWARQRRRKEYAADRLAAALIGEEALIAALRKTARDMRHVSRGCFATHRRPWGRIRALRKLRRQRARIPRNRGNKPLARAFYQ